MSNFLCFDLMTGHYPKQVSLVVVPAMLKYSFTFISLGFCLLANLLASVSAPSPTLRVGLPQRCRTEGKITMLHGTPNQMTEHHLAFSESLDGINYLSRVSIGYVSFGQRKYFSRPGQGVLTIDGDKCGLLAGKEHAFVPELSWFVETLFPGIDYRKHMRDRSHMIGPSGLISLVNHITGSSQATQYSGEVIHRNVPCSVYAKEIEMKNMNLKIIFQILKPSDEVYFRQQETNFFTVKVGVMRLSETSDSVRTSKSESNDDLFASEAFIIDFFDIDDTGNDAQKIQDMVMDFNVPLGFGCSRFLNPIKTYDPRTFSMEFGQHSIQKTIMLAYDHENRLLRRSILDGSVNIWDIKENILYHQESDESILQMGNFASARSCSVLNVFDSNLPTELKPYKNPAKPMNILELMGLTTAHQLADMGVASVRDIPCRVLETEVDDIPTIFKLSGFLPKQQTQEAQKYTVEIYVMSGMAQKADPYVNLWPVQLDLLQWQENSLVLVDRLDIYAFQWSLEGWRKKTTNLFIMPDCYENEEKQVRLEVALKLDRVHSGVARSTDRQLLQVNKFKLERDLIQSLTETLGLSRVHVIDYLLKLRPYHVNLNLDLGDVDSISYVVSEGRGFLPTPEAYVQNRLDLLIEDHETCATSSTQVHGVSLIVWCPASEEHRAHCIVVFHVEDPAIRKANKTELDPAGWTGSVSPPCHIYRVMPSAVKELAIPAAVENQALLLHKPFVFSAEPIDRHTGKEEKLIGVFEDAEVFYHQKLQTISHYSFVSQEEWTTSAEIKRGLVRSFGDTQTRGDCSKLCDLDISCRSYSFCARSFGNQCRLSDLDLRTSGVAGQLAKTPAPQSSGLDANSKVSVSSNYDTQYQLIFNDRCNLHERDYLGAFRETDESVHVSGSILGQHVKGLTPFECARKAAYLEKAVSAHNKHIAMFAFCPAATSTCLLDEDLFERTVDLPSSDQQDTESYDDQVSCRIYRRRYQSYFDVDTRVVKSQTDNYIDQQQVSLDLTSVEACARACWMQMGAICASFDYCNTGLCLINKVGKNTGNVEFETRPGCLHYDRDLNLDELSRQHQIGRHQLFVNDSNRITFGSFLWNAITCMAVFCSFLYGLTIGQHVNTDTLANSIARVRSIRFGSISGDHSNVEQGLYGSSAIRMQDLAVSDKPDD